MSKIQIRFEGPPGHEAGRFVEVEDDAFASICIGEWVQDGDYWLLVIDDPRALRKRVEELEERQSRAHEDYRTQNDRIVELLAENERLRKLEEENKQAREALEEAAARCRAENNFQVCNYCREFYKCSIRRALAHEGGES